MRRLCTHFCGIFAIILLLGACKKTVSDLPGSTEVAEPQESSGYRTFNTSFTPVSAVSSSYLSETTLLDISSLCCFNQVASVSDANLTASFVSDFYKVDPSPFNWDGSWGISPNVESSDPHVLYNLGTDPAAIVLSKPVKTFGVEVFWDGTVDMKVEFWNGSNLMGSIIKSFTPTGSMGTAFLFAATHSTGSFNKIVFVPQGTSNFGFAIAQMRYTLNTVKNVHFDIYPGSCNNNLNTKSQGVIPVVITGSSSFNVNDIDLTSLKINGVSPHIKNIDKSAAPYSKSSDCDCSSSGSDNFWDLSLKFDKPAISQTLGSVQDGAQVTLTLTGKLKDGTSIEGKDCVKIKN